MAASKNKWVNFALIAAGLLLVWLAGFNYGVSHTEGKIAYILGQDIVEKFRMVCGNLPPKTKEYAQCVEWADFTAAERFGVTHQINR